MKPTSWLHEPWPFAANSQSPVREAGSTTYLSISHSSVPSGRGRGYGIGSTKYRTHPASDPTRRSVLSYHVLPSASYQGGDIKIQSIRTVCYQGPGGDQRVSVAEALPSIYIVQYSTGFSVRRELTSILRTVPGIKATANQISFTRSRT